MNANYRKGLVVTLIVLNFSLFFAISAKAQAPASIFGNTFAMEITSGSSPFASSGYFLFLPANSGNGYQIIGLGNVGGGTGTYSYLASGAFGTLNLSDSQAGSISGNLDFGTAVSGSYSLSDSTYGGSQSGEFVMFTNPVPNSIAGDNFYVNAQAGSGLFAASGGSIFTTASSGNAYTITAISAGVTNSYGTYSYSKLNASCGSYQGNDSVGGSFTGYLAFTNSVSGGYYASSSTGYQVGSLTLLTAQAPSSVAGDTFIGAVTSGTTPPFANSGYFLFLPTNSTGYRVIGLAGVTNSSGTYSYTTDGAAGMFNLSDSIGGSTKANFFYFSSLLGSYALASGASGQYTETGDFAMLTNPVPNSIAGQGFYITVTNGGYPYASGGSFTFSTAASGNDYNITAISGGGLNSSGTYSYSKLNASCGGIQLTDVVAGVSTVYLAFSNSVSGGYILTQPSSGGYQIGLVTVLNTTIAITSPTTASSYTTTSSSVNLGGTASDNLGIRQVTWSNNRGGNGVASGTTTWTANAIGLQSGTNLITLTAYDAVSNTSQATLAVIYATPPTINITSPTTNASYLTNVSSINLNGMASDAVGVTQVTWSNNRGGSGTASGTTSWSVTGVALQSGANLITVVAHDAAGKTNQDTLTVTNDTTPPAVSITSPTTGATYLTNVGSINLSGAASDAVGVTQVTWSNNRGGSGAASGTTAWSITGVALQSGANVITVTAYDVAGNTNQDTLTVTNDTTPPAVSITSPTSGATYLTNVGSINLSGTASDAVGVTQVTWSNNRGGSGAATGTTSWSVTGIALQSGANIITVTAYDVAGNTNQATLTVTNDTTPPAVSVTLPTTDATYLTNVGSINLSGTASDAVGVTQVTWSNNRGGSGTATGTTAWSVTNVALQSGANIITVTAYDVAGNTNQDTLTVTNDTTPPVVNITSPTSGATYLTNVGTINLSGTASDAVGVTQVTWSNNRGGSGTASGTTAWNITGVALQGGTNVITITAYDTAGNSGNATLAVTYNPALAIFRQNGNVVLTWPTNAVGFALEFTTNLMTVNWTRNSSPVYIVNGQFTVTNMMSNGMEFYRLSLGAMYNLPALGILRQNGNVVLMWPTNAVGFLLESTTNLTTTNWMTNSPPVYIVNGQYTVTNTVSNEMEFYRLLNP